jgi:hypothetical protein
LPLAYNSAWKLHILPLMTGGSGGECVRWT